MAHFPVTNSNLSAQHLATFIKEQYSFDGNVSCRIIKAGINDTYLLQHVSGQAVFRVYSLDWRTKQEILEELKLITMLKENGIDVSYPLEDSGGIFIQELDAPEGLRYGVLFSFADGDKLHNYEPAVHFNTGVIMARMHLLTEELKLDRPTYNAENMLREPIKHLRSFIKNGAPELEFMERAYQYLIAEFDKPEAAPLRKGTVHMDLWFDNMNINTAGQITIFDFDFCGNSWLCIDIAYYILQLHYVERDEKECKLKLDSFLNGYRSITPIREEEMRALPMLGLAMYFFYLGVQCERFDNWSNVFISETYLKRYITAVVKRYADIHNLPMRNSR
jgi:Ser/Thr protein kinase RdoA (MazF antagonist)